MFIRDWAKKSVRSVLCIVYLFKSILCTYNKSNTHDEIQMIYRRYTIFFFLSPSLSLSPFLCSLSHLLVGSRYSFFYMEFLQHKFKSSNYPTRIHEKTEQKRSTHSKIQNLNILQLFWPATNCTQNAVFLVCSFHLTYSCFFSNLYRESYIV